MEEDALAELPLAARAGAVDDPIVREVAALGGRPTRVSSAGFPYLDRGGWERLRDRIPHLFAMGLRVLDALEALETALSEREASGAADADAAANARRAWRVARQVTLTAGVTAPPDLWLLRHVLGWFRRIGLSDDLLDGRAIYPDAHRVDGRPLDAGVLETDLLFLLTRGLVESYDDSYRTAGHPRARALFELDPLPDEWPASFTPLWRRAFGDGEPLGDDERSALRALAAGARPRVDPAQTHWIPTVEELETGYRLLPLVLGMRAAGRTAGLERGAVLRAADPAPSAKDAARPALLILQAAGWLRAGEGSHEVTELGARGFLRGPGPFGIIEAYHPYMAAGARFLLEGPGGVHVRRGENLAASQDANRATFERAADALDAFCRDHGFTYSVFIEHAVGRGEATRIRYERSGEEGLLYFGADLEDAAIDAAIEEQRAGRLPKAMRFVRRADIGSPEALIDALRAAGADPEGAVMMVGNGFHEVREQTDERMTQVFAGYERAGIILIFTEENALSIDDLRATAWNTYHAGFKYVHEKSGQGLRPASPRPARRSGHLLRAAWEECAERAGYVRADRYSSRTRTIYPYTPVDGHNPAVSTTHFFVPGRIARRLGILEG